MNGRRGFLAALAGLAVCPQAPAAIRSPIRHFAILHPGECVVPLAALRDLIVRDRALYRAARRPIEVTE